MSLAGERFDHGNYLAFNSSLLGNEDNKGFLFVTSSMVVSKQSTV